MKRPISKLENCKIKVKHNCLSTHLIKNSHLLLPQSSRGIGWFLRQRHLAAWATLPRPADQSETSKEYNPLLTGNCHHTATLKNRGWSPDCLLASHNLNPGKRRLGFASEDTYPTWMTNGNSEEQSRRQAALKSHLSVLKVLLPSRRSWYTTGYHPPFRGFGKMLQLYNWLIYYRLLLSACNIVLSVVSPKSTNLAFSRRKENEENLW